MPQRYIVFEALTSKNIFFYASALFLYLLPNILMDKSTMAQICRLCHTHCEDRALPAFFYECPTCKGVFKSESLLPSPEKERERYDLHQNNPDDEGYQSFLYPIIRLLLNNHKPEEKGLDFGCGPGPASLKMLSSKGFSCDGYDPFYNPDLSLLEKQYDYILCSETIEHFHQPALAFTQLHALLKKGGKLYVMTYFYDPMHIDFKNWYYKNDPTHVFLYQYETMEYIARNWGFALIECNKRIAVLAKQ
jgi:SAM-dependent methyltransferase